ncbi:hypothetical protein yc1106_04504 [Curvularia clavata]|uniref:Uncharacterized protein n=1 Tax=Curvularia clavata TaxID=95742 RepID=A0A9Q9DSP9_CURCL|nr:hypothetical protein yc1106_04504 [Curvularia clavata]
MAQVVAHSSHQNAPHGRKRPADGSLENEQRLSKRFDLLNLVDNNGTCLYIPVPGSSQAANGSPILSSPTQHAVAGADPLAFSSSSRPKRDRKPRAQDDSMEVEDTPHRVYISDLSAELSDIESDEENPIFLSDIEKHLSKIPTHILRGPEPTPTQHNQMVLYNVPTSLTVPEAQDNVRKAIVETRQRIRDRQVNPVTEPASVFAKRTTSSTSPSTPTPLSTMHSNIPPVQAAEDGDAMDID